MKVSDTSPATKPATAMPGPKARTKPMSAINSESDAPAMIATAVMTTGTISVSGNPCGVVCGCPS